jgi:hypothetical protein
MDHSLNRLCQFGEITAHSGGVERHSEKRVILIRSRRQMIRKA